MRQHPLALLSICALPPSIPANLLNSAIHQYWYQVAAEKHLPYLKDIFTLIFFKDYQPHVQ
jgi:hypothetical protein